MSSNSSLRIGIVVPALAPSLWLADAIGSILNAFTYARSFSSNISVDVVVKFLKDPNDNLNENLILDLNERESWGFLSGQLTQLPRGVKETKRSDLPRLHVLFEHDTGPAEALNQGFLYLSQFSHDLVGWLNSDELYSPNVFELLAQVLSADPLVAAIYGDEIWIDENDRIIELYAHHRHSDFVLKHVEPYPRSCSLFWSPSQISANFDTALKITFDWKFYLEQASDKWIYLPQPLSCYRIHPGQLSFQPRSNHETTAFLSLWRYSRLRYLLGRARRAHLKALGGSFRREFVFKRKWFEKNVFLFFDSLS